MPETLLALFLLGSLGSMAFAHRTTGCATHRLLNSRVALVLDMTQRRTSNSRIINMRVSPPKPVRWVGYAWAVALGTIVCSAPSGSRQEHRGSQL